MYMNSEYTYMYMNSLIYTSMEATKSLLYSPSQFPSRTQLKNFPSCSSSYSSALMLHEQSSPAFASMLTTSLAPHFPTSVLTQEPRDDIKPVLHIDKTSQVVLETGLSAHEENDPADSDKYLQEFQRQLLHWQGLWYLSPSLQMGRIPSLSLRKQFVGSKTIKKVVGVEPCDVVALAKKALSASKHAALLAEDHKSFDTSLDEVLTPSLGSTTLAGFPVEQPRTVRSTRRLERQSKRRGVPDRKVIVQEANSSIRPNLQRSKTKASVSDDPLRRFLSLPETKQLLTAKEESELIVHIQDLMRLEEVKGRLHAQFGREPTLIEWAEAVGLSSRDLKLQLHRGNNSREKLIYANFRLVVHIAKKYTERGLGLQDLLQEGSMGLMRSVQKFKPQANCRFASYSYWWIRQSVRKAIFQHSRTIRLPDNVYGLIYKIAEAKRQCIQEGHHRPTKEQIAARAGMTVDKLEKLLYSSRTPLSMQQTVWTDQNTTFQQITADTAVETPKASVERQIMRQHIRNLLGVLSPKERKIMRMRYGIEGGMEKSLSDIGAVFGLTKERVRQLESRALYKLRQRLDSEGLDAYEELLVQI